ncbi:MAG: PulJ/GspJ family protein [Pseudomonadales bacterium]
MKGHPQQGFTLLETLIASFIGVMLLTMLLSSIYALLRSADLKLYAEERQEQLLVAQHVITGDLQGADFSGCFQSNLVAAKHVSNGAVATFLARNGALSIETVSEARGQRVSFVSAKAGGFDVIESMRNVHDDIDLELGATFSKGDELLITDCDNADIFAVSGAWRARVRHASTHNISSNLSAVYHRGAHVYPLKLVSYEIYTGTSGVPGLYRREGNASRQEVVPALTRLTVALEVNRAGLRSQLAISDRRAAHTAVGVHLSLWPLSRQGLPSKPLQFKVALLNR